MTDCDRCEGTGELHELIDIDDDLYYNATSVCPDCRGAGRIDSSTTQAS